MNWDFWLGQAPEAPYTENRCRYHFRYWFEYSGGEVTDWGVHHTDIALWALGARGDRPRSKWKARATSPWDAS